MEEGLEACACILIVSWIALHRFFAITSSLQKIAEQSGFWRQPALQEEFLGVSPAVYPHLGTSSDVYPHLGVSPAGYTYLGESPARHPQMLVFFNFLDVDVRIRCKKVHFDLLTKKGQIQRRVLVIKFL